MESQMGSRFYVAFGLVLLSPAFTYIIETENRDVGPSFRRENSTESSHLGLADKNNVQYADVALDTEPKPDHSNNASKDECERRKVDTSLKENSDDDNETPNDQNKVNDRIRNRKSNLKDNKRQNTVDENKVLERKKKERVKEFWRRAIAREGKKVGSTKPINRNNQKTKERPLHRSKRWEYYDTNYNWENDGADYNTPDSTTRKETNFEKWAKNWQKHALRFIFIFSFIMMFVCCCCAGCKKFFSKLCSVVCLHCKDWRDVCLNRDPTYRMMRKQADEYGIKLDYEEYKRIKNSYEQSLKKHGYSNVDISGR